MAVSTLNRHAEVSPLAFSSKGIPIPTVSRITAADFGTFLLQGLAREFEGQDFLRAEPGGIFATCCRSPLISIFNPQK
jgi:hypothetical protein